MSGQIMRPFTVWRKYKEGLFRGIGGSKIEQKNGSVAGPIVGSVGKRWGRWWNHGRQVAWWHRPSMTRISKQTSFWISTLIAIGKWKRTSSFSFYSYRDCLLDTASGTSVRELTCFGSPTCKTGSQYVYDTVPDLISADLRHATSFLTGSSK